MNERIKELSQQCWDTRIDGRLHFDIEMFAELVRADERSKTATCPTCEALARTVMLDQTGYDPRPWVGLTPEEVKEISFANRPYVVDMVVALEDKLKEKNCG